VLATVDDMRMITHPMAVLAVLAGTAAVFFWIFLIADLKEHLLLIAYIAAFTPPYLVLLFQSRTEQIKPSHQNVKP